MMTLSIRTKLILSYLFIALTTALLIYALIRATSISRLESLLAEQQIAEVRSEVEAWYASEQSWDGFVEYFRLLHPPPPPQKVQQNNRNSSNGKKPPSPPQAPGMHGVIDADGRVLAPIGGLRPGELLPDQFMTDAIPVIFDEETVAYIITNDEVGINLAGEETIYLQRTNEVLIIAGTAATILALVMGMGLATLFNRPIRDLIIASKAVANHNLEQHVPIRSRDELGQLTASFNQMSHDLAVATNQRRQMTADIAHDLSTPLQVISGYVEAMRDGSLAPTPERLDTISHEIGHLHRLIEDLDVLAQTDTETLSLEMDIINTANFLQRTEKSFAPLARANNIMLRVNTPAAIPSIRADEERLMQVMGNLISNAIRYTPDRGVIMITAEPTFDALHLHITDTGCGISKEELPYIFDRFYSADSSRTGGKMGLGLAISKALVEAMGGTITAASSPNGTTFTISLLSMSFEATKSILNV